MKLEMNLKDMAMLGIVVLLSVTANLPDSLIGQYVNRDILLTALAAVVIIALFRYLRWMLFLMVAVLAIGANIPEQMASVLNIDPVIMVVTLVVLVLISILNHLFKLLPADKKESRRIDNSQSRHAVLEAIKSGSTSKLQHLLNMHVEINFLQDGTSPAHLVAEQGNNEMMQVLLNHEVNLNVVNRDGLTPLEVAMAFGFKQTVELLNAPAAA